MADWPDNLLQECCICRKTLGACLKCEDCPKNFHVSCAWTAGYKFAFEFSSMRKKRFKEAQLAKFRNEEGAASIEMCLRPLLR